MSTLTYYNPCTKDSQKAKPLLQIRTCMAPAVGESQNLGPTFSGRSFQGNEVRLHPLHMAPKVVHPFKGAYRKVRVPRDYVGEKGLALEGLGN